MHELVPFNFRNIATILFNTTNSLISDTGSCLKNRVTELFSTFLQLFSSSQEKVKKEASPQNHTPCKFSTTIPDEKELPTIVDDFLKGPASPKTSRPSITDSELHNLLDEALDELNKKPLPQSKHIPNSARGDSVNGKIIRFSDLSKGLPR